MAFKTLEEANEYQIEMEKKLQESKQALEGLQLKYESLETDFNNSNEEIKRLKIMSIWSKSHEEMQFQTHKNLRK